jgi:hypothetical protein
MARPVAAQAVRSAVALLVVKPADSRAAAPAALQADAAALVASLAGAVVVAAAETLGAAALNCGDQRSRRTLNPRSSFYPPCRCSDARRSPRAPRQRH